MKGEKEKKRKKEGEKVREKWRGERIYNERESDNLEKEKVKIKRDENKMVSGRGR